MSPDADTPPARLPPIPALAVATMVLVLIAGILTAAYLPGQPPLGLTTGLLVVATALLLGALVALARVRGFAWRTFFLVGRWALLAYLVIGGMLELIFVLDGTPANILAFFTVTLVLFALDVPLLFAFSVARFQPAGPDPG